MRLNKKPKPIYTHEGARAKRITPEQQLQRSVMACMLWENEFYEDGVSISERIHESASKCSPEFVSKTAIDARTKFKLRHSPLWLALSILKHGGGITERTVEQVVRRPDEMCEILAMYWKDGKKPIPNSLKRGLAKAFLKFDEYQLAKYDRPGEITLRDVMRLVHPKPKDAEQKQLFRKLMNGDLDRPNTWESRMAGGQDKREVFEDLLNRNKLGYMALLRNLRGMLKAGVSEELIKTKLLNPSGMVLPYRFISAAKHAPRFEPYLDQAMIGLLEGQRKLKGRTIMLVDVSASMSSKLSSKSEMERIDAACGLAILLSSKCESLRVFTFSNHFVEVPPRQGMALRDSIVRSQINSLTRLGASVHEANKIGYDRLIVLTDEQSCDPVPNPNRDTLPYMINVASNQNGVGYGAWKHINGFSEGCVDFIEALEESPY